MRSSVGNPDSIYILTNSVQSLAKPSPLSSGIQTGTHNSTKKDSQAVLNKVLTP